MMRGQFRSKKDEEAAYKEDVVKVWEKCAPNR
jgi:hypothetical protein